MEAFAVKSRIFQIILLTRVLFQLLLCYRNLFLLEEDKTLPFGAVYDYYNYTHNIPVGEEYIPEVERYEQEVLSKRK